MPATVRYDEQYCPIARALDVLGDRWTLLILRDLVGSDQRFTDLRRRLPGIAPTLLTQRLRTMMAEGLVATKELPPPAARSVYTITDRGRSAVPVMRALARWGMPLLDEPTDHTVITPWMAANAVIAAYYDPIAAEGIDERYLLRIADEEILLSSVKGRGTDREPDLVLEAAGRMWVDIRQKRLTVQDSIEQGALVVKGRRRALRHFQAIFDLR